MHVLLYGRFFHNSSSDLRSNPGLLACVSRSRSHRCCCTLLPHGSRLFSLVRHQHGLLLLSCPQRQVRVLASENTAAARRKKREATTTTYVHNTAAAVSRRGKQQRQHVNTAAAMAGGRRAMGKRGRARAGDDEDGLVVATR